MHILGEKVWRALLVDNRFVDYHPKKHYPALKPFVYLLPNLLLHMLDRPVTARNIIKAKSIFLKACLRFKLDEKLAEVDSTIKLGWSPQEKAANLALVKRLIARLEEDQSPSVEMADAVPNELSGIGSGRQAPLRQVMFQGILEYRDILADVDRFLSRENLTESDYVLDHLKLDRDLMNAYHRGTLTIGQLLLVLPMTFIRHDPKP